MTSLIIGPLYLTYEKIKEHRDGKRRIRNIARYEDLRREHEGEEDTKEDERWRLDQQRMKTGFALPETEDGRVRVSHDWEIEREREWAEREMRERSRHPSSLRASRTGSLASRHPTGKRESWNGDYRSRLGSELEWENGRISPGPRRSLQVGRPGRDFFESDSTSDRSSAYNRPRSDMSRSREFFEPQQVEVPKPKREEEPKDMSSLFVDDILRERGLS